MSDKEPEWEPTTLFGQGIKEGIEGLFRAPVIATSIACLLFIAYLYMPAIVWLWRLFAERWQECVK